MGRFNFNAIVKLDLHDRIVKAHGPAPFSSSDMPIGTIFTDNRTNKRGPSQKFIIVKAEKPGSCKGCDLLEDGICTKTKKLHCSAYSRVDKTWVVLKKYNGSAK